ncbi:MAG: potassium/proton antiporter [Alistipes sp.]|jgi:cell volume regulation protein A|nr:potassium/proton antiporter [Alistipes sp.]
MHATPEIPLTVTMLIGAVLLLVSVFASKAGSRFGVPSLLLFLVVGMLFGSDGLGIPFDNAAAAQAIGTVALCVILFSGGFETKFREIRPVLAPGVVLATVGVLMTALLTGGFIWLVSDLLFGWGLTGVHLSFLESLLMGSVMSSTDSASVFSILRSKKQGLRENLRPLLELESGSNDPMAYILTVILLGVLGDGGAPDWWMAVGRFAMQMAVGATAGYVLGRLIVWTINRINLHNTSLYGILLLAMAFIVFGLTDTLRGNGYLAVYIAGLVAGNKKIVLKKPLTHFLDGFTWLFQIIMFLSLGLLVSPRMLFTPGTAIMGIVVGLFMIVVARPATVFACMAPFRKFTLRARGYVSWVGLRGAVPIIFATYPLVAVADGFSPEVASLIFNAVFFITILSLVIQGSTVSPMASWMGLSKELPVDNFGVDLPDKIKSALSEIEVGAEFLSHGSRLGDISLPGGTLVVMVKRGDEFFVPTGVTVLRLGDKLLVLTDNDAQLKKDLKKLGIDR